MIIPPVDPADKTRQKSCNACVRSKRRCDKLTPRCKRCSDKGVQCVYPNLPSDQHQQSARRVPRPSVVDADMDAAGADTFPGNAPPPLTMSSSDQETPSSCSSESASFVDVTAGMNFNPAEMDSMILDPMLGLEDMQPGGVGYGGFGDFMNYMSVDGGMQHDPGSEMRLWRTGTPPAHAPGNKAPGPKPLTQPALIDHRFGEDEYKHMMASACANITPWEIHDPASRVGAMFKNMTNFPLVFARTRETPFIHHNLYRGRDAPRTIMTLYTATTTYAARNETNRDWAIRVLYQSVDELLKEAAAADEQERAESGDSMHTSQALALAQMVGGLPAGPQTVLAKLARVQALFLYQIMRATDGDIGLRAQAERDQPTLEAWLRELEGYRDNLAEFMLMDDEGTRARPPKSWEGWIMHESLRRTILTANGFIALYEMFKWAGRTRDAADTDTGAQCGPDPGRFAHAHRWTSSRWLWEAEGPTAFYNAWRDKPRWFVENVFVAEVAKTAAPADVDEFTKLWLTTFMGVDECKNFMAGENVAAPNECPPRPWMAGDPYL